MTNASEETVDVAALIEGLERLEVVAEKYEALLRENKILREELAHPKQWRCGRSSERIEPGQLGLFEGDAPRELHEPTDTTPSKRKKKPSHGRAFFPEHLPRNTSVLELDESERSCDCGVVMAEIGTDVTECDA